MMNLNKTRGILFLLLWLCLGIQCSVMAQELKCDICGHPILEHYYYKENEVTFKTNNICLQCESLKSYCFTCRLPVLLSNSRLLNDGRYICKTDDASAIKSDEAAKEICTETVNDLNRLLVRWMEFPLTNSLVTIVNRFYLENLFKTQGSEGLCVSYHGATVSNPLPDGRIIHNVAILSELSRFKLMAVCAHEFTHAYIGQNHIRENRKTKLGPNMEEGLCELVAHKYIEFVSHTQENTEVLAIEKNTYTHGKIQVLMAAEARYGFNAILEWFKNGDDATLTMDHLERIRAVGGNYVPIADSDSSTPQIPVGAMIRSGAVATVPTNLVLKSISGAGNHRFAMINSTTFESNEKARVRLGSTNVVVQCLEIKKDSVIIHVDGADGTRQLTLANQ